MGWTYIEEEASNIIHPIEENVGFVATQSRRYVEPEIVVLSSKDVEQRNILDDDFIDDDCLDEELSSGDEENNLQGDDDIDSDWGKWI